MNVIAEEDFFGGGESRERVVVIEGGRWGCLNVRARLPSDECNLAISEPPDQISRVVPLIPSPQHGPLGREVTVECRGGQHMQSPHRAAWGHQPATVDHSRLDERQERDLTPARKRESEVSGLVGRVDVGYLLQMVLHTSVE